MSHASKLLLLSCLASTFACIVPPIEQLDKDKPIEVCSADHPMCPPGAVCFEDRCIQTAGLDCVPGTRRACGSDTGECLPGTELCGAQGVYGACENRVTPVFEKCDGKDNDCDDSSDEWEDPVTLTRSHDLATPAAAIVVRRAADGSNNVLLTLTSEEGGIVSRTLAADGTWTLGRRFARPPEGEFKMPALAAHGDAVAAAWLGVKPWQPAGTSLYQILLTVLDGSGLPTTQDVISVPLVDATAEVTQFQVAINKSHVLVLYMAGNKSFVFTVPRSLDTAGSVPLQLGAVQSGRPLKRWFQATVSGTWEQFLVAYENYFINPTNGFASYTTYTATISNAGAMLGNPRLITKDAYSQSPFILPTPGDPWEHSVYYAEPGYDPLKPTETRISTLLCGEPGCEPATVFAYFDHDVLRMQMVAPPGATKPEMALFKWQDGRTNPIGLTALTFADKAPRRNELAPRGEPTLSESLIVMPDSTRFLLYNQKPPPPSSVSSLAVGFAVSEAHLLPFCSP